jgi:transposase
MARGIFAGAWASAGSDVKRPEDFAGIFIHRDRVDMRKSINGLSEIVQEAGMGEIRGPHLFVFAGRKKSTIKVLYWDRSGFALWMKRLEEARFPWPGKIPEAVVRLSPEQFGWLLDGVDVWKMKRFSEVSFERIY